LASEEDMQKVLFILFFHSVRGIMRAKVNDRIKFEVIVDAYNETEKALRGGVKK
jgi:hypothetical protein